MLCAVGKSALVTLAIFVKTVVTHVGHNVGFHAPPKIAQITQMTQTAQIDQSVQMSLIISMQRSGHSSRLGRMTPCLRMGTTLSSRRGQQ